MPEVFISYSRQDQAIARSFAEEIERAGFRVWWDQAIHPGEAFDEVTERALQAARAVVVLWSKASVDSRWVRAEATQANADGRLLPVMIEPCRRPIIFELTHTADLTGWNGNTDDPAWRSFIASVGRQVQRGASAADAAAASVAREPADPPRVATRAQEPRAWPASTAAAPEDRVTQSRRRLLLRGAAVAGLFGAGFGTGVLLRGGSGAAPPRSEPAFHRLTFRHGNGIVVAAMQAWRPSRNRRGTVRQESRRPRPHRCRRCRRSARSGAGRSACSRNCWPG